MSTNKKKKRIVLGVVGSICIIAIGVAFVLTYLFGYSDKMRQELEG